jgi:hypothetical protein
MRISRGPIIRSIGAVGLNSHFPGSDAELGIRSDDNAVRGTIAETEADDTRKSV